MEHFLRVQLVKLWSSSCTPLFSTLSGAAAGAAEPQMCGRSWIGVRVLSEYDDDVCSSALTSALSTLG